MVAHENTPPAAVVAAAAAAAAAVVAAMKVKQPEVQLPDNEGHHIAVAVVMKVNVGLPSKQEEHHLVLVLVAAVRMTGLLPGDVIVLTPTIALMMREHPLGDHYSSIVQKMKGAKFSHRSPVAVGQVSQVGRAQGTEYLCGKKIGLQFVVMIGGGVMVRRLQCHLVGGVGRTLIVAQAVRKRSEQSGELMAR
jgi:hypothetical protein